MNMKRIELLLPIERQFELENMDEWTIIEISPACCTWNLFCMQRNEILHAKRWNFQENSGSMLEKTMANNIQCLKRTWLIIFKVWKEAIEKLTWPWGTKFKERKRKKFRQFLLLLPFSFSLFTLKGKCPQMESHYSYSI